ncbi:SIR2 family protein [Thermosulfurimonas dismutans]|uniref:Uncharacterized protein n=1 Tax=Thermosulfurimonas dismutans TaxID=999894 RepID=A0A179D4V4_9BACT|nr:SIR2 family protein [Thermosulfurimonas dismutans]OAQ20638.1 hypothetical protein TDIS_1253 [Thermosulfurimonas dismutans]
MCVKKMFIYSIEEEIHLETLIENLKSNKELCCFWLGAGVSKIAGYPLWEELIMKLKEIFIWRGVVEPHILRLLDDPYLKFPQKMQCFKGCHKYLYIDTMKKVFEEVEYMLDKEVFKIIGKFLNQEILIITTNIDKGLQNTLNLSDDHISIIPIENCSINSKIIYLHGRIDKPESWVFAEEDYAKFYHNPPRKVRECWEKIFNNYMIFVYIGYSLTEMEIYSQFFNEDAKRKKVFWIPGISEKNKENIKNNIRYFRYVLELDFKTIPYIVEDKTSLIKLLSEIYDKAFN